MTRLRLSKRARRRTVSPSKPGLRSWPKRRRRAARRKSPSRPVAACLRSTGQRLPPKKSTRTAGICSAASRKTSDDCRRRGHAYGRGISSTTSACQFRREILSIRPARRRIVVSAVSLAEIVYLVEKSRLPENAYADLKNALADPDHVLKEAPFTVEIVDAMRNVSRAAVPDMPDRIVAATAVYFGVPVLSRDGRICASNVQTVW